MCKKVAERTAAWRRERRVLLRVSRAAWRLEQAERERTWALASARAEGVSIRTLAAAVGLSSSRVHQIVADADLDELLARCPATMRSFGNTPSTPSLTGGRRSRRTGRSAGSSIDAPPTSTSGWTGWSAETGGCARILA